MAKPTLAFETVSTFRSDFNYWIITCLGAVKGLSVKVAVMPHNATLARKLISDIIVSSIYHKHNRDTQIIIAI